jgi:glycosyltransferase involved in cell wall biosynthesis
MAAGLERARFQPLVVLPDRGELAGDLEAAGVEVLIRDLSVVRRELMSAAGLAELGTLAARTTADLRRLIVKRRVALVHSNTSVVLSGSLAAGAARVPHIWHVREIYSRFGRAWPAYRVVLETAAALPCVSRATAAQFGSRGRIRVLHDGLAIDARRAPAAAARQALGVPADAPVIAVLGRISDWKGQDVLIRALAEPALAERGALGLIAGDVWPGAESREGAVRALADRLGVADRLIWAGFRADVENVYGAADIVAIPSTQPDPLPGSAVEAAAAGCAVVAAAHGGLPEIISDGVTGRLVRPGDTAELAAVCAGLLDDDAERARLGNAAASEARTRFAPERLLEGVQRMYDEVLS